MPKKHEPVAVRLAEAASLMQRLGIGTGQLIEQAYVDLLEANTHHE